MARLTALPSANIIHGFKGTIDFYLWRGLACARRWPRNPKSHHSVATRAASILFGAILSAYKLLDPSCYAALVEDAKDQARTPRDIWVSAVFGHLHEAAMTDFLTLLTECRNSLAALEALLDALGSVDTDDLQVDVKSSALPAGASTLLEQQTQTTALQLIDNLQDALASVATDALQVRGENQLFSYKGQYLETKLTVSAGGVWEFCNGTAVPAGEVWVVTSLAAYNTKGVSTTVQLTVFDGATAYCLRTVPGLVQLTSLDWQGHTYLVEGDILSAAFQGTANLDVLYLGIHGFKMTLET